MRTGAAFPLIITVVVSFITAWVLAGAADITWRFYSGSFLWNAVLTGDHPVGGLHGRPDDHPRRLRPTAERSHRAEPRPRVRHHRHHGDHHRRVAACRRMIDAVLARDLRDAGLRWRPVSGDAFAIDRAGTAGRPFTVSEMTIEPHEFDTGTILGFNGTTEWALDSLALEDALWLPREDQLRELLGASFRSLQRTADGFRVEDPAWHGGIAAYEDADAATAYGRALLVRIGERVRLARLEEVRGVSSAIEVAPASPIVMSSSARSCAAARARPPRRRSRGRRRTGGRCRQRLRRARAR